jgi:ubiquitin-protein ligase
VEISFPLEYPRTSPEVRLISKPWPVHPNIWADSGRICLQGTRESWIPGIGAPLDSICQMIGEIIAFQEVNLKSPANNNSMLRTWITNNLRLENVATVVNPVDPSPIRLPDIGDAIRWGDAPSGPRIRFG